MVLGAGVITVDMKCATIRRVAGTTHGRQSYACTATIMASATDTQAAATAIRREYHIY